MVKLPLTNDHLDEFAEVKTTFSHLRCLPDCFFVLSYGRFFVPEVRWCLSIDCIRFSRPYLLLWVLKKVSTSLKHRRSTFWNVDCFLYSERSKSGFLTSLRNIGSSRSLLKQQSSSRLLEGHAAVRQPGEEKSSQGGIISLQSLFSPQRQSKPTLTKEESVLRFVDELGLPERNNMVHCLELAT